MNLTLGQLGGMIRYEALMQFRRRTIIVLAAFFIVGAVGLTVLMDSTGGAANQEIQNVRFEGDMVIVTYTDLRTGETVVEAAPTGEMNWIPRWYSEVDFPRVMATWKAFTVLAAAMVVLLIAVPPMLAEVIPLDRQYKIREVMDALPLPRGTYLIGKLLATWLGVVGGLAACALIYGVYSWMRFGAFEIWTYTRYWLFIIVPLSLVITGYAVLAPAFAASRRTGVIIGILLIPLSTLMAFNIISGTYLNNVLFAPVRVGAMNLSYEELVSMMFTDVFASAAPYAAILIGIGVFMWAWMRFREAK